MNMQKFQHTRIQIIPMSYCVLFMYENTSLSMQCVWFVLLAYFCEYFMILLYFMVSYFRWWQYFEETNRFFFWPIAQNFYEIHKYRPEWLFFFFYTYKQELKNPDEQFIQYWISKSMRWRQKKIRPNEKFGTKLCQKPLFT